MEPRAEEAAIASEVLRAAAAGGCVDLVAAALCNASYRGDAALVNSLLLRGASANVMHVRVSLPSHVRLQRTDKKFSLWRSSGGGCNGCGKLALARELEETAENLKRPFSQIVHPEIIILETVIPSL